MDKVSVIVPVYNAEHFLQKCIQSLIHQTYKNIEIILIDDGSTDQSKLICEILSEQDSRIIFTTKKNEGVSSARNLGISISSGKYTTFLDADDWIETTAIKNMVEEIKTHKADCVRTGYFIDTSEETVEGNNYTGLGFYAGKEKLYKLMLRFLNGEMNCYSWLLLIESSYVKKILYNENISMMEDVVFYMDLLLSIDSIYISDIPTYHYFQNTNSASKSIGNFKKNSEDTLTVSRIIKETLSASPYYIREDYSRISAIHLSLIVSRLVTYVKQGDDIKYKEAVKILEILTKNPDFQATFAETDLSILPRHLKYSIKAVKDNNFRLFWSLVLLRTKADSMRRRKNV